MIALIIFLVVILCVLGVVGYYSLKDSKTVDSEIMNNLNTLQEEIEEKLDKETEKQVFNVSENIFSFEDAKAVCQAYGGELASLEQVIDAHKEGADWCNYGWSEGQLALYPTQEETYDKLQETPDRKNECGKPGINGGFFADKNMKFGANCYAIKPRPEYQKTKELEERYLLNPLKRKIDAYETQLDTLQLSPFSSKKWSKYEEDKN